MIVAQAKLMTESEVLEIIKKVAIRKVTKLDISGIKITSLPLDIGSLRTGV